ncbi:MAG: protease inhibitor I42 family protein [Methanobacterium sp.]|nr:protease inhibitor I42 family protein [Methanobacterium sp.]
MERYILWGVTLFLLFNILIAGSFAATNVSFKNLKENQQFNVSLDSNPSTGYSWDVQYDPEYLKLISQQYIPQDNGGGIIVGAGGTEVFTFETLKKGLTTLIFNYHGLGNEEPTNTQIFFIHITDSKGDDGLHPINKLPLNAATIPMQNTGIPFNLLVFALSLIGLGTVGIYKK